MVAEGADFSKLKLRFYTENFRGVHACQEIDHGETVVFVPRTCLITTEDTRETELAKKVGGAESALAKLPLSNTAYYSMFLIEERRKENSHFRPYLNIMPTGFDDYPVNFSDQELEHLKGSFLPEMIKTRKKMMSNLYDKVLELNPEFSEYPR